jgi:1-acyl-sn-glycerol-3-phosphate acyltransferase
MALRPSLDGMPRQAAREARWPRVLASAIAFALFGMGGVLIALAIFPLQRLLGGGAQRQQARARATIHRAMRLFLRVLVRLKLVDYRIDGAQRLGQPGQLIVANHPSLLDVAILLAHVPQANCIVKRALARNPWTLGALRGAGYITNGDGPATFEAAQAALRRGETLIVFPEGTRTPRGAAPRFQRGASAIGLRAARVITPVVIRMRPRALAKGDRWYRLPARTLRYAIEAGPDIDPQAWAGSHPLPQASRHFNDYLQRYYATELNRDDTP